VHSLYQCLIAHVFRKLYTGGYKRGIVVNIISSSERQTRI